MIINGAEIEQFRTTEAQFLPKLRTASLNQILLAQF